jgi:flagellar basal body L-ring protein FlgH
VIAIGNQAISGADKLVAVAQGIQQLAADGVINPKAAEQAKTVAQITYSLVKEAGLLKAAA